MSDNAALIEEANEFLDADFPFCDADGLEERLVRALEQAERDLTELGTAFRDYKIVHPEGTEDLHRKLAGQAATLAAIREWRSTTLWAQPNWASLKAILDPTEGTR